jgi:hypothetical protein
MNRMHLLAASALACLTLISAARADIILSMNDNHTVLDEKANQVAPDPVRPDSIDIIDVTKYPPHIIATIEAPCLAVRGAGWAARPRPVACW